VVGAFADGQMGEEGRAVPLPGESPNRPSLGAASSGPRVVPEAACSAGDSARADAFWDVRCCNGSPAASTIATGQTHVFFGIAVDDTAIYWSTFDSSTNAGQLMRLAK
jgi:hypothetical protein